MIYVAIIETPVATVLLSDEKGTISLFKSQKEGLICFESNYKARHQLGYEASISAAINFIQFNPTIIGFKNTDELEAALLPNFKNKGAEVLTLQSISGSITGVQLERTEALEELLNNGKKPRLI
jgi:hypothetical protein